MLGLLCQMWQISLDFPCAQAKGKGPKHTIPTLGLFFFWGSNFSPFPFFLPALHAPSNSTYNNSPGCLC